MRSPKRDAAFLAGLAKGMSVTSAAEAAGYGRATVYDWRRDDPAFAAAWDVAIEASTDRLEDEAWRRAHDGVPEPVVSAGRLVTVANKETGEDEPLFVQRYSDTILLHLLRARRPDPHRETTRVQHDVTTDLAELLREARERSGLG